VVAFPYRKTGIHFSGECDEPAPRTIEHFAANRASELRRNVRAKAKAVGADRDACAAAPAGAPAEFA
jgi:hypothetical protein